MIHTYVLISDTWDRIYDQPHVSVCDTKRWRIPSFRLYILKPDTYLKTDATVSFLRSVSQLEQYFKPSSNQSRGVFLNRRAAARYLALASIIPGRERFFWNLSF